MFGPHVSYHQQARLHEFMTAKDYSCYRARAKALKPFFPWSEHLKPVFDFFLVHSSRNVPGKVAYYSSIPNMVTNRLTRTSPEMFLDRTLRYAPDEIQAAWAAEVVGRVLPTIDFMDNTNPDGWVMVYDEGPGSCMAGSPLVAAYAHPENNLKLAYMEANNRIVHRAIVNTKKKTYLRAYGEHDVAGFVAALQKMGYKRCNDTLHGELIYLIERKCGECGGLYDAVPYFDGNYDLVMAVGPGVGRIQATGDNYRTNDNYCGCASGGCDDDY